MTCLGSFSVGQAFQNDCDHAMGGVPNPVEALLPGSHLSFYWDEFNKREAPGWDFSNVVFLLCNDLWYRICYHLSQQSCMSSIVGKRQLKRKVSSAHTLAPRTASSNGVSCLASSGIGSVYLQTPFSTIGQQKRGRNPRKWAPDDHQSTLSVP